MKLTKVSDIFEVQYGNSLELNKLKENKTGINFVSRTSKNNGVSAIVEPIIGTIPFPQGTITVSLGGSVLETFLQTKPFYTGFHVYCLTPKVELTDEQKLFYCTAIAANKYRYNYGRQANRTLRDLLIPDISEIPNWVFEVNIHRYDHVETPFDLTTKDTILTTENWQWYNFDDLFEIRKGKRLTKANMTSGSTPFIGAIDSNNGYREFVGQKAIHDGNTITVNYNGSVAEAFYQPKQFWASDDVNVLYPKFRMNQYNALFIVSLIKFEKYRFNYGRKWHVERMRTSLIKLPSKNGVPDFHYMESFIKTLPYSQGI